MPRRAKKRLLRVVKLVRYGPPRPKKHHPLSYSYIRPFDSSMSPAHSGKCGRAAGHLAFTPLFLPPTSLSAEKTRQAACTPHRERISPVQVAWRQPATLRRACEAAAAPQTPHWSPKKHFRASQGARAAQDATDAAPGTLTRRRQPALAQGCSSPRVGARSTPRGPARDRGRASPGQSLGGGAPLAPGDGR